MYSGVDAVYYNKTAFKKAGIPFPDESWDWEKYGEIATKLTDPANQQWGRRLIASYDRTLQRIHQAGGHYVDPKDNRRCIVDQPEALRALQYEFDAGWKHQHAAKEDAPGFPPLAGMNDTQIMASGRVVMSEEGSWRLVTYMNDLSPHVDWDVAPMPKGPVQRDALATNDGWSIWKGSKVPDEAWEWMKFLQGDEWMEINTRATGQQTARKSFQDKWVKLLKEANPGLAEKNLKPFTDAIQQNYARPIELFEKHAEAATIMNKAQNDSIRDGKTTVEAAYREAARQINALHAR
jgi:multiple sugar transport system substrate-binding protein